MGWTIEKAYLPLGLLIPSAMEIRSLGVESNALEDHEKQWVEDEKERRKKVLSDLLNVSAKQDDVADTIKQLPVGSSPIFRSLLDRIQSSAGGGEITPANAGEISPVKTAHLTPFESDTDDDSGFGCDEDRADVRPHLL